MQLRESFGKGVEIFSLTAVLQGNGQMVRDGLIGRVVPQSLVTRPLVAWLKQNLDLALERGDVGRAQVERLVERSGEAGPCRSKCRTQCRQNSG
jgi:hypothetical protein